MLVAAGGVLDVEAEGAAWIVVAVSGAGAAGVPANGELIITTR